MEKTYLYSAVTLTLEVCGRGTFSGKGMWKGYLFRERYVEGVPFQGTVCGRGTFSWKGM